MLPAALPFLRLIRSFHYVTSFIEKIFSKKKSKTSGIICSSSVFVNGALPILPAVERHRVGVVAVGVDFEVEVVAGGATGGTDIGDVLTACDARAR